MKKILFLLLLTTASYGQALFDKGVKITGGITTDNTAPNVVVKSSNNVLNTIAKTELQDAFYFATASALPVVGITDKLYITRDDNKLYRFNGTIYVPFSGGITSTATNNFIPKVNSGGNLENSRIFDNGTNFGFGTETPVTNASATMDGAAAISLILRDSGGTGSGFVAQNNTQIANNERLGYALFGGLDSSNNSVFASGISSNASTAWTPTSRPANLMFETTNITGTRAVRGQFNARGAFLVNIIADNGLDIAQFNGTISVATATQPNQAPRLEQLTSGLALKANIASPTFTGTPSAPTAPIGTNTTQLATTAFVLANAGGAPQDLQSVLDTGGVAFVDDFNSGVEFLQGDANNKYSSIFSSDGTNSSNLYVDKNIAYIGSNTLDRIARFELSEGIVSIKQSKKTGLQKDSFLKFSDPVANTNYFVPAKSVDGDYTLATTEDVKRVSGWASYSTTTFTNASPFTVAPNTTVTLPNNANNSITTDLPLGVTSFYNGTTNKITPAAVGDAYTVNVRFKARTTMNNDYLTLFIDIGNGSQINAEAKQFLKGANTEQPFSFTMPIFTLATFVANGGEIKVASNGGTISIYDVTFYINRNYTR